MKAVINQVIGLIIGVIVIIILAPLLFKVAGNVWTQLGLKLGWVKLTPVEKAILCSYYRCTIGCANAEVTGVFGGRGWCADFPDACNLPSEAYEGEEKKVCGWNAGQWPVEVELKSGEDNTISKDKLQALMGIDCLVKLGSNVDYNDILLKVLSSAMISPVWSVFKLPTSVPKNNIVIPESLISSYRGKEKCSDLDLIDAYKEVKLKEGGKAYITTDVDTILGVYKITFVYSAPIYFQLHVGEWAQFTQEAPEKKLYRIIELDEEGKKTGEAYVRIETRAGNFSVEIVRPTIESESKTIQLNIQTSPLWCDFQIEQMSGCEVNQDQKSITCMFCRGKYRVTFVPTIQESTGGEGFVVGCYLGNLKINIERLQ